MAQESAGDPQWLKAGETLESSLYTYKAGVLPVREGGSGLRVRVRGRGSVVSLLRDMGARGLPVRDGSMCRPQGCLLPWSWETGARLLPSTGVGLMDYGLQHITG